MRSPYTRWHWCRHLHQSAQKRLGYKWYVIHSLGNATSMPHNARCSQVFLRQEEWTTVMVKWLFTSTWFHLFFTRANKPSVVLLYPLLLPDSSPKSLQLEEQTFCCITYKVMETGNCCEWEEEHENSKGHFSELFFKVSATWRICI